LLSFGATPSTPKGLLSESESDLTALATVIKKLHQEAKIKTKNVASALPQDQVSSKLITLPKVTEEELDPALKWEAEQYVPFPLEEATLAHQVVGEVEENKQKKIEVLLVATPTRLVNKLVSVLKAADLNPVSVEMEITAIARSLVTPGSGITMVVDLGAKATDLAIVENDQVVLTNSLATAGDALTRAISLNLSLDPSQAEAYKKAYGVDPEKLGGKITTAIDPVLEVIIREIEKMVQFYQSKGKAISRIILTGGTSGLPEVAILMAKKISLEIQIGNPFSRLINDSVLAKVPRADISLYAGAVGLALKRIS